MTAAREALDAYVARYAMTPAGHALAWALRHVLDLHDPEFKGGGWWCPEDDYRAPCPTVTAIQTALGDTQ